MMKKRMAFCLVLGMLVWQCGKLPGDLPEPETGSIQITAQGVDRIDSIRIRLDDSPLGLFANPHQLDDVGAGVHALAISEPEGPDYLFSSVVVSADEVTRLEANLNSGPVVGPFIGQAAPVFTATALSGEVVGSADFEGRVTLLIFMEYT